MSLFWYFPHSISGRHLLFYSCFESNQTSVFPQNHPDFSETGIGTAFLVQGGQGLAAHLTSTSENSNINITVSTNLPVFNPISAKAHYINVPSKLPNFNSSF